MKSYYELTDQEASKLEHQFINTPQGRKANQAMHICIIIGIIIFVASTIILTLYLLNNLEITNPYLFTILLLFIIIGGLIVYLATIEYHKKYNSYLEIKHQVIKK